MKENFSAFEGNSLTLFDIFVPLDICPCKGLSSLVIVAVHSVLL